MAFVLLCFAVILQGLVLVFMQLRLQRLQRDLRYLEEHFDRLLDTITAAFRAGREEA